MCQKLLKLVGTRQRYCSNKQAYFFWPALYVLSASKHVWMMDAISKYSPERECSHHMHECLVLAADD